MIENRRLLDAWLFIAGILSLGLRLHHTGLDSLGSMFVFGLHAALLPRTSDLLFRDRRPGVWAAIVVILLPVPYFFPRPEGVVCAVGLMLFCLATDRRLSRGGAGGALFTGLFAGLLALWNPICVMVCGLWLLFLLSRRRIAFAATATPLIALAFLAVLATWIAGSPRHFRALFVSDSPALEVGIFVGFLAVGSFLGSALMARRRTSIAMLLAAVPVAYPVVDYFVRIDAHYRVPILWVSLLGSGYLLSCAVAAVWRGPAAGGDAGYPPLHLLE